MKTNISLIFAFLYFTSINVYAQVGIGTTTPDFSAQLDVSSTNKGFLPPRLDSTQIIAITSPTQGLTVYNTSIKAFQVFNGTKWYSTIHYIGENYAGGIVFYIYDNGQHGLIASTADQSAGIQWHNGTYKNTGATGNGLNAGALNTVILIAVQMADNQLTSFATKICNDYNVTIDGIMYGSWYLPSKYELNLLYLQRNIIGGFANYIYWSSTEYDYTNAWTQTFPSGIQTPHGKNDTFSVRAIRAF